MKPNQQAPATSTSDDTLQTFIPTKNKPALTAYYFGVFGFIPFLGLPLSITAIVLGRKGLKQFASNPTPGAKGHAKAGVIMGIIQLVIWVGFVGLVLYARSQP